MYNNDSTVSGIKSFQIQFENDLIYNEQIKKLERLTAILNNTINLLYQDNDLLFAYIDKLENDVAAYKKELEEVSYQLERLADKCRT